MADEYVIVLTTWPANADAGGFARTLVEERLAACVNVLPPMTSFYRWEGRLEEGLERQIVMKTARARVDALRERLHTLHLYEVPECIVLPIIEGSDAYLAWIADSVQTGEPKDLGTQGPKDPGT